MKKFLLAGIIACLTQVVFAQRYLTDTFTAVDSTENIIYGSAPDYQHKTQKLLLDFYEPRGDKAAKRMLIIYAHGGGLREGTRKWISVRLMCEKLAIRGYAVASIDYRLNPHINLNDPTREITDAMHDFKAAVRFFKANHKQYRVDTANFITGGESAGAEEAMYAAYFDKQADLKNYPKTQPYTIEGSSGNPGYSSRPKAVLCLCGGVDTTAMDKNDPPLLWVHGSKDPITPISWARLAIQRAKNIGLPYKAVVYKGATHCPWYFGLPNWQRYMDSTVNHVSKYLYSQLAVPVKKKSRLKK